MTEHSLTVDGPPVRRVPGRRNRRGWFRGFYVARCSCGWRGQGREYRWEARLDARAHRDGWGGATAET